MQKFVFILAAGLFLTACGNSASEQKEEQKAEEKVQEVMKSDQERMDSMRKAMEQQMNQVSDDSLVKQRYGN